MPWIDLSATDAKNQYKGTVTVTNNKYQFCDLFFKYDHKIKNPKYSGDIWVYNKYTGSSGSRATFKPIKPYNNAPLSRVEVYFNIFDQSKTPLILVFYFSGAKSKYYKYTNVSRLIRNNSSVNIPTLTDFKTQERDKEILGVLFEENDKIASLLTFEIDKRISNGTNYNNNRIRFEEDKNGEPNLSDSEFTKHKHASNGAGRGKNGCILYKKNPLMGNNEKHLINFQNKQYWHVNVYYSNKSETPLLLEVGVNDRKRDTNEFYCHIMKDKLFWEKLDNRNFEKYTGHTITNRDNIYKQLTDHNNNKLFKLLEILASNLFKTIYFFVDKQNGNYGESDVKKSLGNRIYNLIGSDASVKVSNMSSTSNGKCLTSTKFKVYQHNFSELVKSITSDEKVKLKFTKSNLGNLKADNNVIDIDNQISIRYSYKEYEVSITTNFNIGSNYTWYRHSTLDGEITKGVFNLKFNGETVNLNGTSSEPNFSHKLIIAYFKTDDRDKFVIIAFPSIDQNNIRYLTYDVFKKAVKNGAEIKFSELSKATVNVKHKDEDFGNGQKIDSSLVQLLNKEYEKSHSIRIQVDKITNQATYKSGSINITVEEKNDVGIGYKRIDHRFDRSVDLYEIVFYHNYNKKTLDISGEFSSKICSISFYFHSKNVSVPLIVCISTDINSNNHFKYSDFIYTFSDKLNLADIKLIDGDQIQRELSIQYSNLISYITLDIFSNNNFDGFNITSPKPYGNYKYYWLTPSKHFKHIKLKQSSLYEFEDLNETDYTYDKLLYVILYYHGFDKENKCPLIIYFYRRNIINRNQLVYDGSYHCLSEIKNTTFIKKYKKIELNHKELTNQLNTTYEKFKWKIDKDLSIHESIYTHSLDYSNGNDILYVYFYGEDPRPLLICYGGKAYKRYFLGDKNSKWIEISGVNSCICNENQIDPKISNTLDQLSEFLCLKQTISPKKIHNEPSVQIDTSKEEATYNNINNITVSPKREWPNSNLFKHCTHTLTADFSFKISSFEIVKPKIKSIRMSKPIDNVTSVNVYFSIYSPDAPVLLEIIFNNQKKKYLKDLNGSKSTYDPSSLSEITENQLIDELITESDKINNRTTYQIDKIIRDYGTVTVKTSTKEGFTVYTHTSNDKKPNSSNVLNNRKYLHVESVRKGDSQNELQNKNYNYIQVYALNVDKSFVLLIETNESESITFFYRKNIEGTYKKLENFTNTSDKTIRNKLDELYYLLSSSIVVEIDKKYELDKNNSYEMKLIDNNPDADGRNPKHTNYLSSRRSEPVKSIQVTDVTTSFISIVNSSFKCYSNDLSQSKKLSKNDIIGGIRLFLKSSDSINPYEVVLFDSNSSLDKKRIFLFYRPNETVTVGSGEFSKIKVFFHKFDDRPLLFCYKGQIYRRIHNNKNVEWYYDRNIRISDSEPLITLKNIYRELKKKLFFLRENNVKDNVDIKKNHDQSLNPFKKDSYIAKVQSHLLNANYRISKNRLNSEIIDGSRLDELFGTLYDTQFDYINIYTEKQGSSLKNILLFEFINESNRNYFKRIDDDGKYWVKEFFTDYTLRGFKINLQKIKSEISDTAIYEIDNTSNSYSTSISLSPEPNQPNDEFNKYTHTPTVTKDRHKKSLFYYNGEILMKKVNNDYQILSEINDQKYKNVVVYFGKRFYSKNKKFPLIIELITGNLIDQKIYYYHRRDGVKHFWDYFKITNDSGNKELIQKLNETEFDLLDSVVILLEKTNTGNYDDTEIKRVVGNLEPKREINVIDMKGSKKIDVYDQTEDKGKGTCVKDYKYKLISHDFNKLVNGLGEQGKSAVGIRFVMTTINNKYNLITLYTEEKAEPQNIEYIYYDEGHNEIYVYFYGDDPRPLLISYADNVYKPKNKDSYTSTWVKDSNISNIICRVPTQNIQLLNSLNEIMAFLNHVELNINKLPGTTAKTINKPPQEVTYELHKYNNSNTINIKVSSRVLNCYNIYSYEPDTITDTNAYKFRLGTVLYTNQSGSSYKVDYTTSSTHKYEPLLKVTSYYYKHDSNYENPLLIQLEFKGGKKEYYQLNKTESEYKWTSLDSKSLEENNFYNILFDVNKQYNNQNNIKPDESECKTKTENPSETSTFTKTNLNPHGQHGESGKSEKRLDENTPGISIETISIISVGSIAGSGAIGGGGYLLYAKVIVTAISVAPS